MTYERTDDLPEFTRYCDKGCRLAASCLNCPFPFCAYDISRNGRKLLRDHRNAEIVRRFRNGEKKKDLAACFRLNVRTVRRIVRKKIQNSNSETRNKR